MESNSTATHAKRNLTPTPIGKVQKGGKDGGSHASITVARLILMGQSSRRGREVAAEIANLILSEVRAETKETPAAKPVPKVPRRSEKTIRVMDQVVGLLESGPKRGSEMARLIGVENRVVIDSLQYLQRDGTVIGEGHTSRRTFRLSTPSDANQ